MSFGPGVPQGSGSTSSPTQPAVAPQSIPATEHSGVTGTDQAAIQQPSDTSQQPGQQQAQQPAQSDRTEAAWRRMQSQNDKLQQRLEAIERQQQQREQQQQIATQLRETATQLYRDYITQGYSPAEAEQYAWEDAETHVRGRQEVETLRRENQQLKTQESTRQFNTRMQSLTERLTTRFGVSEDDLLTLTREHGLSVRDPHFASDLVELLLERAEAAAAPSQQAADNRQAVQNLPFTQPGTSATGVEVFASALPPDGRSPADPEWLRHLDQVEATARQQGRWGRR